MDEQPQTWCPSAPSDRPEAVVLGVHAGHPDGLVYLDAPVPAAEAVGMLPEGTEPKRVLRFASHCDRQCQHRVGQDCGLVTKVSIAAPRSAAPTLPRCHLRPRCQWWTQVGVAACQRCSLVTTAVYDDDDTMKRVADPTVKADQL